MALSKIDSTGLTAAGVTAASLDSTAQYTGFKNRIINGAMMISQRGTSFAGVSGTQYIVDRFNVAFNSSGAVTSAQVSTAPAGFVKSWQQTVTTTKTPGVSDYAVLTQSIEGSNFDDLGWGTTNAQTVTISFWVKSSIAGTYCIFLRNPAAYSRSYVATYTINSANTWEQKTITVAGDTTGTWAAGTGGALQLGWDLGSGSQFQTTAGSWQTGSSFRTSGSVNWISTNGATFNLTGVQLEKGSTATAYDYRPYGTELALCQRYYENGTAYIGLQTGSEISDVIYYRATKRSNPDMAFSNKGGSNTNNPNFVFGGINQCGWYASNNGWMSFDWTSYAEI